jgi:hypothetical protein
MEPEEIEKLEDELLAAEERIEELKAELAQPPKWGNCRRGCPESYLDREGFCSPACKLGAPRGKWVTAEKWPA